MGRRKTKNPPLGWKTKRQQQKIEAEGRLHKKAQVRESSPEEGPSRPPSIAQMQANAMDLMNMRAMRGRIPSRWFWRAALRRPSGMPRMVCQTT